MRQRDCDDACSDVDIALAARTSLHMREEMCRSVDGACGTTVDSTVCHSALPILYEDLSGLGPGTGGARGIGGELQSGGAEGGELQSGGGPGCAEGGGPAVR